MKNLWLLIVLTGFSLGFAQNSAVDPYAEKLLAQITEKYQKFKTAHIQLELIIDIPDTDDDEKLNVEAYLEGDKFRIELADQIFISDNQFIWNFMKEYNEVQINNYDEMDVLFSPSVLFNMYNDDYLYRLKEEYKNAQGKMIKIVELTPADKSLDFFKIDVVINESDKEIVQSKIYEKSGIHYIYKIKKFTPNITLDEDFFTFKIDSYPGVKVSDLR